MNHSLRQYGKKALTLIHLSAGFHHIKAVTSKTCDLTTLQHSVATY